jgi:HSP20 family protein
MVKKRKRPFGFFGLDEDFLFGEEFGRMREEMEEMMKRMAVGLDEDELRKLSGRGGSRVYGFSMRIGPDGKPVVREFGDVSRQQGGQVMEMKEEGEGEREPLVDVFRDKKGVHVVAEMPGVEEKEVKIEAKGRELEIKANGVRKYYRKVELPEDVGKKKMSKKYRNGILELIFS